MRTAIDLNKEQIERHDHSLSLCRYSSWLKDHLNDRNVGSTVQRIDFNRIVQSSIKSAKAYCNNNKPSIYLNIIQSGQFYTNPYLLKLILDQIVENSVVFSDSSKVESFIDIEINSGNKQTIINIVDNGVGIDSKYRPYVFKKYYCASKRSKGFGLGLFIVKESLKKIGGTIHLSSCLNVGTYCVVYIPNAFKKLY